MIAFVVLAFCFGSLVGCLAAEIPTVAEIKQALQQCVDKQNRTPGIVVGVIDTYRTNVIAYDWMI